MKAGRASRTAELVCIGRALAHGNSSVAKFSDPTALALLPQASRARVQALREPMPPKSLRARIAYEYQRRSSKLMVARTVAIDDAIREAGSAQLVILGAGLDGRAWRMAELKEVTVFEVDHPDSQREKRERAAALPQAAREVRFVPVDFEREQLDLALRAAHHDPARATTWVWEGVVMYLTVAEVEATLAAIASRSAAASRLVVLYHSPALVLRLVGLVMRRIGEPLRSTFSAAAMRALLGKYGFRVVRDQNIPEIAAGLSEEVARATKPMKHMRLVTAEHATTTR